MAFEWKDVLASPPRRTGRKRFSRGKLVAATVTLAAAAAVMWRFARPAGGTEAAPPAPGVDAAIVPAVELEVPKVSIKLYAGESGLTGVDLMAKGDLDGAEKWLRSYLAAPDGREDLALYALGMLRMKQDRVREAEDAFRDLISRRQDSLRAGDGWYELGEILAGAGRRDEARDCFREAVRTYGKSRGGTLSARRLADELYAKHVDSGRPRRVDWEPIRNLYSIALRGLDPDDPTRAEMIERLDRLNRWVIFTPYSRPRAGYPSNITFHAVRFGETVGGIAHRYGVTPGSVRRLNRIEGNIIRPDEELKVLRGTCEVFVDLTRYRLTVWIGGCFFREYDVGIGRDGRTPIGTFRVVSRLENPHCWKNGESISPGDPRNVLGT
ncbi:MAG: tetratricopeptide repeat protein, partial [Planctomycetota bacterium]